MRHIIFGESHGPAVGVVLEGLPPGVLLDMTFLRSECARRAPGRRKTTSERKEDDEFEILSGVFRGRTTGTPLCALIRNADAQSRDYDRIHDVPRPSHADFAGAIRYAGHADHRGGGHFSGRLTAPLVFAGAVAQTILRERGVVVCAHLLSVGKEFDAAFDPCCADADRLLKLKKQDFPAIRRTAWARMEQEILAAKAAGDSIGGIVECKMVGVPAGKGAPDLGQSAKGIFSEYLFCIPGVRAVSIGSGFDLAQCRGSEGNDAFYFDGDTVKTHTNHSGGLNGGVTNGMPILISAAFRPTPSVARPQESVNLRTRAPDVSSAAGRHDPCIAVRAVPVVEAAAALAACKLLGI